MVMIRNIPSVAVIGAGPAGLACAERLSQHGLRVQVYDQNRIPGGRAAVKRHVGLCFEHGACGQQALIDALAATVPILSQTRVTALTRMGSAWRLHTSGLAADAVHASVVLAIPAPAVVALLPELAPSLSAVRFRPVLSALLGLPGPLSRAWDRITFTHGNLSEAHRQAPSRPGEPEAWVLHASPIFSQDNLECDLQVVARHLWDCFRRALALDMTVPTFLRGHRWREGLTLTPLGQSCGYDAAQGIGVCGDWCLGDSVDAALASGRSLAERMLGLPERPPRILLTDALRTV